LCKERYTALRRRLGRKPMVDEYFEAFRISDTALVKLFGPSPYSKLQEECGDKPNKLEMVRTALDDIMVQYGDLALKLGRLPTEPDWRFNGCRPGRSGLRKAPHHIMWSDMPSRFSEWASSRSDEKYNSVVALTPTRAPKATSDRGSHQLSKLLADIGAWSPGRMRNSEGEYKIELRKTLEALGYAVNEEHGESNADLVVEGSLIIETKKAPQLSDYDRLFGQIARHLNEHPVVIAIIFDVTAADKLDSFKVLVDRHLNTGQYIVQILKK